MEPNGDTNYLKLAYILLEIIPTHLRIYFIKLWNEKYQYNNWDNVDRKDRKLKNLLLAGRKEQNLDIYTWKILNDKFEEWDATTLVCAILHPDLKLLHKGCRPIVQRSIPLYESEEIDVIRGIQNSLYGPDLSIFCTDAEFNNIMVSLKTVVGKRFGIDAQKEISDFDENFSITRLTKGEMERLLENEFLSFHVLLFL